LVIYLLLLPFCPLGLESNAGFLSYFKASHPSEDVYHFDTLDIRVFHSDLETMCSAIGLRSRNVCSEGFSDLFEEEELASC
jgi:hypothetical protein